MQIQAFVLLAILGAVPACALERVTVTELEQAVASAQHRSDTHLARLIGSFELTQRMSPARFTRLDATLPGHKSHDALVILADTAAFLDLPNEELPSMAPPDQA